MLNDALDSLVDPPTHGNVGFITVTLTWDGPGDVDLHVYEPNDVHVFYAHREGMVGYLDYDNMSALGPEHYYATCDSSKIISGNYRIGINNYARATGRTATLQIATAEEGELFSTQLDVGQPNWRGEGASPVPVANLKIYKDLRGKFKVALL
ncbi:MAG: hypothetical protein HQK53_05645 [Oligoflexia bacterium]|nr:hypothetical protein [Oligoflexia bacterium]